MNKLLQLGAIFCGIFITQVAFAQNMSAAQAGGAYQGQGQGNYGRSSYNRGAADSSNYAVSNSGGSYAAAGNSASCPEDHPVADQATGDCWCMYVHYKPCYYTTKRCVEEKIPCKKTCCRQVDQYYEVDRCRWVPEHYTETCCKKVPEYYEVDDCKICQKVVCDQHCEYVPQYYWKHVCGQEGCTTACPK